jgi:DNA polymerase
MTRPLVTARIDFETYSEAGYVITADGLEALPGASQGKKGLQVVGAQVYVEHPSFEVLTLSYNIGQGVRRWKPGNLPPVDLFGHIRAGGLVSGWNSGGFEVKVWAWLVRRMRWPAFPVGQWRDTMADARAFGLPGALGEAAKALHLVSQKDPEGKRLLDKFSVPRKPTKTDSRRRIKPEDDPEDAEKLYAYCDQDVRTEQGIAEHVPELSPAELAVWQCDRKINDRGVRIDMAGVEACCEVINQAHAKYNVELRELTGGAVSRASEIQKLSAWLTTTQGLAVESLDVEHLENYLLDPELPAPARRALEIRAAIGSASVKKVFAMRNTVSAAGRLHDLFLYHGARTGRTTGSGPQPTNLPNSAGVYTQKCNCGRHYGTDRLTCSWCGAEVANSIKVEWGVEAAKDALETIGTKSLTYVEYVWGDAMLAVAGCLRTLFVAAEGYDLMCSDYSSIEAVVLAELAGEQWRKDVFRTHGKIYEMSASQITNIPFEEYMTHVGYTPTQLSQHEWWKLKPENKGSHHPTRKTIGKIAELAAGYGGWTGSMKAFGAEEFMTEEEMVKALKAWRNASPSIVEFWGGQERNWKTEYYGVEGMTILAIKHPGHIFEFRGHFFQVRDDVLFIKLLSGREMAYQRPRIGPNSRREGTLAISFEGWNSNPKNGAMGWQRMETYGPRLTENIGQATSRDIQWHGILALEAAGYPIVLHVYDEDIAEVPKGFGSLEEFERVMSAMPPWAAGWPVVAKGGWVGERYRK